jgi:hypothetical protein
LPTEIVDGALQIREQRQSELRLVDRQQHPKIVNPSPQLRASSRATSAA